MDDAPAPRCWRCGYDLTGMRIDDRCPECGIGVWTTPPVNKVDRDAASSMTWGILALVLGTVGMPFLLIAMFVTCFFPWPAMPALIAIPAVTKGHRVGRAARSHRFSDTVTRRAKTGRVCGWIAVGMSSLVMGLVLLWFLRAWLP